MRIPAFILSGALAMSTALALPVAHPAAQAQGDKTLTGTVTIKSKGRTTAVHGTGTDKAQGDFLFCIDQAPSASAPADFTGSARVIYRALPAPPMPAGVVIEGPENVAQTLAVVAADGRAWQFVGKGQKPILGAADPAAATTSVQLIRRTDWARGSGPRRGTDIEGCLAPGG